MDGDLQCEKCYNVFPAPATGLTLNSSLLRVNHWWNSLLARGDFGSVSLHSQREKAWCGNTGIYYEMSMHGPQARGKAQQERLGSCVCPLAEMVNMHVSKVYSFWISAQRIIKLNLIWGIREKAKPENPGVLLNISVRRGVHRLWESFPEGNWNSDNVGGHMQCFLDFSESL